MCSQKAVEKKIRKTWRDVEGNYYDQNQKYDSVHNNYLNAYKKIEDVIDEYNNSNQANIISSSKKLKFTKKIFQLYVEFKNIEKEHTGYYYKTKEVRGNYIKSLKEILNHYQVATEYQIELLKGMFMDFFAKLKDKNKAEQITIESEQKKINESISKTIEIEKIIKSNLSNKNAIEDVPFSATKIKYKALFKDLEVAYFKNESLKTLDLEKLSLKNTTEAEFEGLSNPLKAMLVNCWTSAEILPEKTAEFKDLIKIPAKRREFADILNYYRAEGHFDISNGGFKNVGNLLLLVLDEIDNANDIEIASSVLILSQTYFVEPEGKVSRIFLQQYIQNHKIWKRLDFWQELIQTWIDNEKKQSPNTEESECEKIARIESGIFGKLGTIAQNMIHLGVDVLMVEQLIMKHARENDLSKEITTMLQVIYK